jgi:hypothetical protein
VAAPGLLPAGLAYSVAQRLWSYGGDWPSQLAAVMGRQADPDQRMMLGQNLRVDVLPDAPQQRGRALDIGE